MKRRDWWIGIAVAVVLLLHAVIPRYEWQPYEATFIRIDRWMGTAEVGTFLAPGARGRWTPASDQLN